MSFMSLITNIPLFLAKKCKGHENINHVPKCNFLCFFRL